MLAMVVVMVMMMQAFVVVSLVVVLMLMLRCVTSCYGSQCEAESNELINLH